MIPVLKNLIGKAIGDITGAVGNALDANLTNEEEKLAKKNELTEILTTKISEVISFQRDILVTELNGNGLQRNWRPIVMLAFAFIVVYRYFIAPVFHLELIDMPEKFWDLLELGLGGYVIGRSVEKVADTVTKNIDLSLIRKKDRKA
ncbi:MAG: 3TM-type holin [Bacteroidia bacterium]|nr:3TM-type holin [Bacteroidia bacterium]